MDAGEVRRRPGREALGRERLLAAVIPVPLQRRPIPRTPQPLPQLSAPQQRAVESHDVVLGMASLDGSGRVHDRAVLSALDWCPGQRVDITSARDMIMVRAAPTGLHAIGARGEVTLLAAVRTLCGIPAGSRVVLAAFVAENVLLVHSPATVVSLLCAHYAAVDGDHGD